MKGSRVYLSRMESKADYNQRVREGLDWIGWEQIVAPGARVFIKPNFTVPNYMPGVTTSPELIAALVSILKERTDRITIGESNGGLGKFTADEAFAGHGLSALSNQFHVRLVNLSRQPWVTIDERVNGRRIQMELPKLLLEDVDVFIDAPVFKTHVVAGVTLGLKNLWGCIPNSRRLLYHAIMNEALTAIAKKVHPQICVVDGFYAMDGSGPMFGDVVDFRTLLVADGVGTCDVAACRIMEVEPGSVPHLQRAQKEGLLPSLEEITFNVQVEQFGTRRFRVKRDLTNWMALWFSKSRAVTWLVYLSPLRHFKDRLLKRWRSSKPSYGY